MGSRLPLLPLRIINPAWLRAAYLTMIAVTKDICWETIVLDRISLSNYYSSMLYREQACQIVWT